MRKIYVVPYKAKRKIVKEMRNLPGCIIVKARGMGTRVVPDAGDLILNWGCSQLNLDFLDRIDDCVLLNKPEAIRNSVNKVRTFQVLDQHDVPCLEYTEDYEVAAEWCDSGSSVYCRTQVAGFGGKGIVVADSREELVHAELYTKAVINFNEYRVHVFDGEVTHVAQKKKRNGVDADMQVRNHKGGWVFVFKTIEYEQELLDVSLKAMRSLGLTFGAVDVIVSTDTGDHLICEVNSAPAMTGTTLERFVEALYRKVV